MNRAFVREPDGDKVVEELPDLQHSDLPNYITSQGLQNLKSRIRELETQVRELSTTDTLQKKSQIALAQRDLRYLQERVRRAQEITPPAAPETVQFGVTVKLVDDAGKSYLFTLVGEDETDIEHGRVGWATPIAKLLTGREVADEVNWSRGGEKVRLEIIDILLA